MFKVTLLQLGSVPHMYSVFHLLSPGDGVVAGGEESSYFANCSVLHVH